MDAFDFLKLRETEDCAACVVVLPTQQLVTCDSSNVIEFIVHKYIRASSLSAVFGPPGWRPLPMVGLIFTLTDCLLDSMDTSGSGVDTAYGYGCAETLSTRQSSCNDLGDKHASIERIRHGSM